MMLSDKQTHLSTQLSQPKVIRNLRAFVRCVNASIRRGVNRFLDALSRQEQFLLLIAVILSAGIFIIRILELL